MRQIGTIDGDRDAERFSDYLLTQGIANMVEEQGPGGAWSVWVENDDLLDRGRSELDQFRANPNDPRYAVESKAERIRKQSDKAQHRRRTQYVDMRTHWSHPTNLARPVTILLAVLSIIASIAGPRLGLVHEPPNRVTNALQIAPVEVVGNYVQWNDLDAIRHGQVWRLITPIFLHFSIFHLLFNMFVLLDLGSMIETRRGSLFLAIFVLVVAAGSNLAEYYLPDPRHPNPMFGGMSGIGYALFGYAWIKGKYQPHLGIGVSPQTVTIMFFWFFLCFTPLIPGVANMAHLGGLVGGVLFAYVPYLVGRLRRGR